MERENEKDIKRERERESEGERESQVNSLNMVILIQATGRLSKVGVFSQALGRYKQISKGAKTNDNRATWRNALSGFRKASKEYALEIYPGKGQTTERASARAHRLVELVDECDLGSDGKRWILEELVQKHSEDQTDRK